MRVNYSFIIPAYNSSTTIQRCLDHIYSDCIQNILDSGLETEVIVVENGSEDNTVEKVNEWKEKNMVSQKNISFKLIHSEKGVSKARNCGIKAACGEFIIFVDADDIWLKGGLEAIVKDVSEHLADLYVFGFVKGSADEPPDTCRYIKHVPDKRYIETKEKMDECIAWLIRRPTLRMQAWAKVYRRDLIEMKKIYFDESLSYSEDSEFVVRYLLNCNSVNISEGAIYQYVLNPDSAMHQTNEKRIDQYVQSMQKSYSLIREMHPTVRQAFYEYALIHLNIILVHDVFFYQPEGASHIPFKRRNKLMKRLMKQDVFKEALENTPLKNCMSFQLLPELCMKLHISAVGGGMNYVRSYLNYRTINRK